MGAATVVLSDCPVPRVVDPQGTLVSVNERVARLLHWLLTHQELLTVDPFVMEVNARGKALTISCPTVYIMPEARS